MRTLLRNALRELRRHWRYLIIAQATLLVIFPLFFLFIAPSAASTPLTARSWGGWAAHPQTERCYKQERIATLLAFWLGPLGVDQWYARHWVLAVFKMLTLGGLGVWHVVDVNLWIVGGIYGTPGCPGGSGKAWAY
ncbi:hypothetical protein BU26DRAFT_572627 [Trematosphaeria pertusa]|uniref:TM2 domain-containing protein n=1 Tax=Trematosphaeria pertusa TaxID=390896 RepID=A0A6A6HT45_9PLEO|nr:uncharacterized protein BU26DRAFT_572627 [Trematosphaeria pertusa]KAF2240693.1 hypothetical protein BU26DRAFT_572627 [Trematosphaeria pertusa]